MIKAAKEIAELVKKRIQMPLGQPSFRPVDKYHPLEFNLNNFKPINKTQDPRMKPPKLAFLDGGNLPLIEVPSFAVHFERVYFNCFQREKRCDLGLPNKIEFFVVVTSNDSDNYETVLLPLNNENKKFLPVEKDLVFDSYDPSIRTGRAQIEISRIGDIARSFAEWQYAKIVCENLDEGDIFIRDGTLHAPYSKQVEYAEKAYEQALKNAVFFCGVSKTSQLYTTTGLPLVAAIGRLARENHIKAPGYYENLVEISDSSHRADLNFARFHKLSKHTFRVEILKDQKEDKSEIMSALAEDSKDLSFPGYPYGLVDADKNARVSYDELEPLRMMLLSEISKTGSFDLFQDFLSGTEAHAWLNQIV
jgi:hypothetical protein